MGSLLLRLPPRCAAPPLALLPPLPLELPAGPGGPAALGSSKYKSAAAATLPPARCSSWPACWRVTASASRVRSSVLRQAWFAKQVRGGDAAHAGVMWQQWWSNASAAGHRKGPSAQKKRPVCVKNGLDIEVAVWSKVQLVGRMPTLPGRLWSSLTATRVGKVQRDGTIQVTTRLIQQLPRTWLRAGQDVLKLAAQCRPAGSDGGASGSAGSSESERPSSGATILLRSPAAGLWMPPTSTEQLTWFDCAHQSRASPSGAPKDLSGALYVFGMKVSVRRAPRGTSERGRRTRWSALMVMLQAVSVRLTYRGRLLSRF